MTRSSDAYVTHRKAGGRFAPASITAPPLVPGTGSSNPWAAPQPATGITPGAGPAQPCASHEIICETTQKLQWFAMYMNPTR